MNTQGLAEIRHALTAVHDTLSMLTFAQCDQDEVVELIDRVECELASASPNDHLIGTFLNSISRSLRTQPQARAACLRIEVAIERAGLMSTWQAGL